MTSQRPAGELALRWLTLEEIEALPPIPSGYTTNRVLNLIRDGDSSGERWELREVTLLTPLVKRYDRGTVDEWLESYLDESDGRHMAFLVAEDDGHPIGLLACRRLDWNNTLWLLDIRVRESRRRGGIGSELMAELKAYARDLGVRGVLVETQTANLPAIRFYQRHAFAVCGFNDHLYANDDLENQEVALYLFWEAERTDGS